MDGTKGTPSLYGHVFTVRRTAARPGTGLYLILSRLTVRSLRF